MTRLAVEQSIAPEMTFGYRCAVRASAAILRMCQYRKNLNRVNCGDPQLNHAFGFRVGVGVGFGYGRCAIVNAWSRFDLIRIGVAKKRFGYGAKCDLLLCCPDDT